MTTVFDALDNLAWLYNNNEVYRPLIVAIQARAVEDIETLAKSVGWKILTDDEKKDFKRVVGYISGAHAVLDHSKKYHLKVIQRETDRLIVEVKNVLIKPALDITVTSRGWTKSGVILNWNIWRELVLLEEAGHIKMYPHKYLKQVRENDLNKLTEPTKVRTKGGSKQKPELKLIINDKYSLIEHYGGDVDTGVSTPCYETLISARYERTKEGYSIIGLQVLCRSSMEKGGDMILSVNLTDGTFKLKHENVTTDGDDRFYSENYRDINLDPVSVQIKLDELDKETKIMAKEIGLEVG